MFYVLSWFVVASLIALWSLAAWALHALAAWTVANAGALVGAASSAGSVTLPAWLAPWVPPDVAQWMSQLLAGLGPLVNSLLQAAPALAGGVTGATWVIWTLGSALLVLLGTALHLLVALWLRGSGSGSVPGAGSSQPAGS